MAAPADNLRINGDRLWSSIHEMAKIGPGVAGGNNRQTLTDSDKAGRDLDTQPTGGRYDGVLGVLSGLELVRTLNDLGIRTKHPIVVTNWTNEEGARFAPAMLASGVFAGMHTLDYAYSRKDLEGA